MKHADELENLMQAVNDSLHFFRNSDSVRVAHIRTIESSYLTMVQLAAFKDKQIQELAVKANAYKRKLIQATELRSKTHVQVSVPLDMTSVDTVYLDRWLEISNIPDDSSDSTLISISVKNELSIWHLEKRQGLFKPKYIEVFVSDKNPYSSVQALRSYMIKKPVKRLGFGLMLGYSLSSDLTLRPAVCGGVYYKVF